MIEHRDGRGKPKYWKIRPFIAISIQQSKPRSVREAVTEGFVLALLDSAWPSSGHDLLSHPTGLVPVLVQRAHGAAITSTGRVTNDSYTDGNFITHSFGRFLSTGEVIYQWASSFFYLTHDIRAIDVSALSSIAGAPTNRLRELNQRQDRTPE